MRTIRTFADLKALDGLSENRVLELKRQPIRTDTLVEHIQAAANGEEEGVTMILGAAAQQGIFSIKTLYPIKYPFRPGGKKPDIKSFDEYKQQLYNTARALTEGYFEKLFTIHEIPVEDGRVFVIEIPKSAHGPHQNKQRGHFPIKSDGHIRSMTVDELRRAFASKSDESPTDEQPSSLFASVYRSDAGAQRITDDQLRPGSLISRHSPETGDDDEVRLAGTAYFLLKLGPDMRRQSREPPEILAKMRSRPDLLPMLYIGGPGNRSNRNDHGAVAWLIIDEHRSATWNAIQIDRYGEMSAYDARLLDPVARERVVGDKLYKLLHAGGVEQSLEEVLPAYVQFATKVLDLPLPLRGSVGLHNIEGYRLDSDHTARMTQDGVYESISIAEMPIVPRVILRPFYEKIWLACGRERPKDFREK